MRCYILFMDELLNRFDAVQVSLEAAQVQLSELVAGLPGSLLRGTRSGVLEALLHASRATAALDDAADTYVSVTGGG